MCVYNVYICMLCYNISYVYYICVIYCILYKVCIRSMYIIYILSLQQTSFSPLKIKGEDSRKNDMFVFPFEVWPSFRFVFL